MKSIITNFLHYFDDIDDLISAILGVTSIGVLSTLLSMFSFISENLLDYLFLAFFGIVGQTALYFAKIRFPELFGRHADKRTVGTKILHYGIDCFLAALISILCTEYLIDFIFITLSFIQNVPPQEAKDHDYQRIIFGAVMVGAFYETILKKALKKNKEIIETDKLDEDSKES